MNKTTYKEFKSMSEFYGYICDTPLNEVFRWKDHASVSGTYQFTQTNSFEQAVNLMKNGWSDMSIKLNQKMKTNQLDVAMAKKAQNILSVVGYQAIVPLYLNGVPNNMVNKRMVPMKQKIINITKLINYHCGITTEEITESSIKAMQIVKLLELKGYRVNLYVSWGVGDSSANNSDKLIGKIRIKAANEKMNISKLAFPLVHPSMLRRLMFRFMEVVPEMTNKMSMGYGRPLSYTYMKSYFEKDIVLPALIDGDVKDIKDVDNFIATF